RCLRGLRRRVLVGGPGGRETVAAGGGDDGQGDGGKQGRGPGQGGRGGVVQGDAAPQRACGDADVVDGGPHGGRNGRGDGAGSVDKRGLQQCGRCAEGGSPECDRCQQGCLVMRDQAQGEHGGCDHGQGCQEHRPQVADGESAGDP